MAQKPSIPKGTRDFGPVEMAKRNYIFNTIKACVAYKLKDGSVTTDFPYEIDDVEPVYKEFKGWKTDMTQFTSEDQFPQEFKDYIAFIEEFLETKIGIISIGPDRAQTIVRK